MPPTTALLAAALLSAVGQSQAEPLDYAPAPPDNPLKGFAPYVGQARDFPHSLEFNYLPLNSLMTGPETFDWQPLERLFADAGRRGCQLIFRVFLEYQAKPSGVPQYLRDGGLTFHYFDKAEKALPGPDGAVHIVPNYEDPRLRAALQSFVAALGRRYDGDPRLAGLTAGLLGNWGEWHDGAHGELFASKTVQMEVMDAYEKAFTRTPVLLRYPAAENDRAYAPNHRRPFGYHDDSFAYATFPSGKRGDSWYFLTRLTGAGAEAQARWETRPIGGEVRPEVWAGLWDDPSSTPPGQGFLPCVEATHATWLMDSSIARKLTPDQRERAIIGARRLGYEFQLTTADLRPDAIAVTVVNRGVAPFYADWPVELAVLGADGLPGTPWRPGWRLDGLLPGAEARRWEWRGALPGAGRVLLRVVNPMTGGKALGFANAAQDKDVAGWVTLGEVRP
jgi:hypothetical protein